MQQASDDWQHLHPISPLLRSVQLLVIGAVIALQSFGFLLENLLVALAVAIAFLLVVALFSAVSYYFTRYRMRSENFDYREGVLFRSHRDVPLARLESVDISQPVVARLFGLAELRVEVAGSKDSDVRLRYLSRANAETLRSQLLRAKSTVSDVEEDAPGATEQLIVRVQDRDVLLGYLFLPLLIPVVVLIFSVVFSTFIEPTIGIGVGFGGAFGVAAFVFAFARALERVWGFRVFEADDGFIVKRGLINLLTQKVPLHRVQAVRVETPLMWRLLKRSRLIIDIAGYESGERGERSETSVLLPIGSDTDIGLLLARVLPNFDLGAVNFAQAPEGARWRVPFFWRYFGAASTDRYSITTRRVIREVKEVVPHRKVQSLRITQGPWQRRLDLATLHYDTAGSNIAAAAQHRLKSDAQRLARESRVADGISLTRSDSF